MTWHDSKQKEMISYHDDIHWRFRCLMCRHRLKMHHIIHFGILPQMVQGSWSKSSTCFTAVRHTSQWLVSSDTDTWSLFEASSTISFFMMWMISNFIWVISYPFYLACGMTLSNITSFRVGQFETSWSDGIILYRHKESLNFTCTWCVPRTMHLVFLEMANYLGLP